MQSEHDQMVGRLQAMNICSSKINAQQRQTEEVYYEF